MPWGPSACQISIIYWVRHYIINAAKQIKPTKHSSKSLIGVGQSCQIQFDPSDESLNSSSFLKRLFVKSRGCLDNVEAAGDKVAASSTSWLLQIAFILLDADFYSSSPKMDPYRVSVVGASAKTSPGRLFSFPLLILSRKLPTTCSNSEYRCSLSNWSTSFWKKQLKDKYHIYS